MRQSHKTLLVWILLVGMLLSVWQIFGSQARDETRIDFSQFMRDVQDQPEKIRKVTIKGDKYTVDYTDNTRRKSVGVKPDPDLIALFNRAKVPFAIEGGDEENFWTSLLISWLPMVFLIGIFIVFMRQLQAGGGKAMAFGKSKARLLSESQKKVTFADVAGIEEAKSDVEEIVDFLKDPKKFTRLGGHIPKGVLLVGPPGTGKTLLARAIAGEAGVPFFSISGSDFVEMFVGVGASRVRDLFEQGKKNAPCIIFIDEIDAVGRHRGAGLGGGHDEREQTLNQLLVEMDGFESNDGVILIAATNRPDVLDPALLRPGRFDRRIVVPRPDVRGREAILKVHTKHVPMSKNVDLAIVARGTPGFCGADLENLINEAALLAARHGGDSVAREDFEVAKDRVLMGAERRSLVISDKEKRTTAYHEAGHTLVARRVPHADPIHKVTIIPRGIALGATQQLPIEDRLNLTRDFAIDQITVMMGGRAAEELVFQQQTTGAGNDIESATSLARRMVCEWGMSDRLGPLAYGRKDDTIFLGRDFAARQEYSEKTAIEIDEEVRRIVSDGYARARGILHAEMDLLGRLAEALLEREVLTGEEVEAVLEGRPFSVSEPAPAGLDPAAVAKESKEKKERSLAGLFPQPVLKGEPEKA